MNYKKKLREKFFPTIIYFVSFMFILATFLDTISKKNSFFLISIYFLIFFGTLIISFIIYQKKINATSFIVGEVLWQNMSSWSFFSLQLTFFSELKIYYQSITITIFLYFILMSIGIFQALKNWPAREALWIKNKKIDIEKGYFNILVYSGDFQKNKKSLYFAAASAPILSVIVQRLYKYLEYDKFFGLLGTLMAALIFGYLIGQGIGIYIKIRELERKHNITFKTEYRKLLEEKSQP